MRASAETMQSLNEEVHERLAPYEQAPHLRHDTIRTRLLDCLYQAIADLDARHMPRTILDIGAGTGAFVGPALSAGCTVTATDMTYTAVTRLKQRYAHNPSFRAHVDPGGDLAPIGDASFSLALYASVLHHIPDYMGALEKTLEHLAPGAALLTFQDPLWYASQPRYVRRLQDGMYLAWRVTQRRDYIAGIRSRLRRARGQFDPSSASDMVEYHVLREGVDHGRIAESLTPRFEHFTVIRYWSTQSRIGQRLGEKLGVVSEFATVGLGYKGNS